MIYGDLDGLKQINDRFGHAEGSRAISRIAAVLKNTFRTSDVVSRLGGDEFAILAGKVRSEEKDILIGRLEDNLRTESDQSAHGYPLSLSVGAVWVAHDSSLTVDQLIVAADTTMYDRKRIRKQMSNQAGLKPPAYPLSTDEAIGLRPDAV